MSAEEFVASVTHTVTGFVRDGGSYRNTETGQVGYSGRVSYDCGHTCNWRPLGNEMRHPRAGQPGMCALCIDHALQLAQSEAAS